DKFDPLWRILVEMLNGQQGGKYLLIDALDECEKSIRDSLLLALAKLPSNTPANVKVFVTSRPESDIRETLHDVAHVLRIDSGTVNADLSKYIDFRADELNKAKNCGEKLTRDIKDALMQKAGGTFLWASLVLHDLFKSKGT